MEILLVANTAVRGVVFEPLVAFSSIKQEQPPLARHSLTATGHCPVARKFAPNILSLGFGLSLLARTICLTEEGLNNEISPGRTWTLNDLFQGTSIYSNHFFLLPPIQSNRDQVLITVNGCLKDPERTPLSPGGFSTYQSICMEN